MTDHPLNVTRVIGLGNPLMADDGLGLAALDGLRDWAFDPPVQLVDGGTWGMSLLPDIESAGRLLFLDAINVGAPPGTLVVLRRDDLPRYLTAKLSPHQIDLRDVLALADFRGGLPAETVAIGLQPAMIELATELSPPVRAHLPYLVGRAIDQLEAWGHRSAAAISPAHA
jgi:hydrogenase maturation protease